MTHVTVGVCRETASGERRVALVPESVRPIAALGAHVALQAGAGTAAGFTDAAYGEAGAAVLSRAEVLNRADLLIGVGSPGRGADDQLRRGQALMGMLHPLRNPLTMRYLADHGIIAISLDLMPAAPDPRPDGCEPMDAAASQARITGYEAALIAAGHCDRDLPTAVSGTAGAAARALVICAGTTGLQAAATARSLGVEVVACDTDPRVAHGVLSTGAEYRDLSAARSLAAVRLALARLVPPFDMVLITRREPLQAQPDVLVPAQVIATMRAGSVIVDTTVEHGGAAVEFAEPDTTLTVPPGVTVIGAGGLPSRLARTASAAYARHVTTLLARLIRAGTMTIDLSDPVQDAIVVAKDGNIRNHAVWRQILDVTAVAGLP